MVADNVSGCHLASTGHIFHNWSSFTNLSCIDNLSCYDHVLRSALELDADCERKAKKNIE